jgi:hypothetical protein
LAVFFVYAVYYILNKIPTDIYIYMGTILTPLAFQPYIRKFWSSQRVVSTRNEI